MYFISYRKNFWSNTDDSDHDAIRNVPLDNSSEGLDVKEEKFVSDITDKRVLLLIHGYRNKRENVVGGYGMIENQMRVKSILGTGGRAYDEVVGLAWPGGLFRISYLIAKKRVNKIADSVFARLEKLVAQAKAVDVMTHSLGARVILKAMQNAAPGKQLIRNLILTAPAVDDESIQEGEKFFAATQACRDVYVLYSDDDPVLSTFFKVPLLGDSDRALGDRGPEKPNKIGKNVHLVDCINIVKEHSDYRKRLELYTFIKKVLDGQPVNSPLAADEGFVPGAGQ
jgi:esterase/lipase superfamily enzyme